jgi:hypothetical protein
MKKKILIGVLLILAAIQFIRPEKNAGQEETPNDITHYVNVPDNVMTVLKASCYDCHSNHTNDYWYYNIMPVGWWLNNHVKDGKRHLNFSDFSTYDKKKIHKKLGETAEEVEEKEMPLTSYTLIHSKAKLSVEEIKLIADWANAERKKINLNE